MAEKTILLIDLDDPRRETRVLILSRAGYKVQVCADFSTVDHKVADAGFDLIILALRETHLKSAVRCSERLQRAHPTLPLLLLPDRAAFVESQLKKVSTIRSGDPEEMMRAVAELLQESGHVSKDRHLRKPR